MVLSENEYENESYVRTNIPFRSNILSKSIEIERNIMTIDLKFLNP